MPTTTVRTTSGCPSGPRSVRRGKPRFCSSSPIRSLMTRIRGCPPTALCSCSSVPGAEPKPSTSPRGDDREVSLPIVLDPHPRDQLAQLCIIDYLDLAHDLLASGTGCGRWSWLGASLRTPAGWHRGSARAATAGELEAQLVE